MADRYAWFNLLISFIIPDSIPAEPRIEDYADTGKFEEDYNKWYNIAILPFISKLIEISDEIEIHDQGND